MNIDAGLKKLMDNSKKDCEHCNNSITRSELYGILEAMKEPSDIERRLKELEERNSDLEKIICDGEVFDRVNEVIRKIHNRVCDLEGYGKKVADSKEFAPPDCQYCSLNRARGFSECSCGKKFKPSVPEKPEQTLEDEIFVQLMINPFSMHLQHNSEACRDIANYLSTRIRSHQDPSKVSIPRDVAERFIKDSERKETNIYIGYFINAIKQALKNKGE